MVFFQTGLGRFEIGFFVAMPLIFVDNIHPKNPHHPSDQPQSNHSADDQAISLV